MTQRNLTHLPNGMFQIAILVSSVREKIRLVKAHIILLMTQKTVLSLCHQSWGGGEGGGSGKNRSLLTITNGQGGPGSGKNRRLYFLRHNR